MLYTASRPDIGPDTDTVTVTLTLHELDAITDALMGYTAHPCTLHRDGDHLSDGRGCDGWTETEAADLRDGSVALFAAWRNAMDALYPAGTEKEHGDDAG